MQSNGTKLILLIFCVILSLPLWAIDAKTAAQSGLKKPLSFIENNGQVTGENGSVRSDIQYKLSTPGMNLYVGNARLHYQFRETEGLSKNTSPVITTYLMDVALIGANTNALAQPQEQQAYYENYYTGKSENGITAHSYNRVVYKDVYPNIDWVLYIKDQKVEYDFIVHNGADVSQIKLQYSGATALRMTATGGIMATTPMGTIEENTPYAYETNTGKKVTSKFVLHDNVVSFETGAHTGSLTIDPSLVWATYFGGTLEDQITSIQCDATGNIYAGGFTSSTAGVASAVAYQTVYGGGTYDAFLVRYNAAGTLAWATYFGGTGNDQGFGVATDALGNVYLAGSTTSAAGISTGPAYQPAIGGLADGFLARFSVLGFIRWATYFGGTDTDVVNSVYCDAGNNVIIGGSTKSGSGIATVGAFQGTRNGPTNGYIAKFARAGTIIWATYYGGSAIDEINAVTCDAASNIIVGGNASSSSNIATPGAYQTTLMGVNDAFVASFSTGGTRNWGSYFGGTGIEAGNGIAVDASGNAYLTGNTASGAGIASTGAYQTVYGGFQDAYLASFKNTGLLNWSTYIGGPSPDYGQCVCVDIFNNIIVGGATFSASGIATFQGFQTTLSGTGTDDAFYAKFNTLGQNIYGSYFGNVFDDYAMGVTTNGNSNIFLAGYTSSIAGISTASGPQPVYGGGLFDGFIAEFSADILVSIVQPFIDTLVCQGGTLVVNYTTTFNFLAGNVFSVQLSDGAGSFAAPVVIGSAAATTSGAITCVIPAATPLGTGYKIRITSTSPAFVSPNDFKNIQVINALPPQNVTGTTTVCVGGTIKLYDTATYQITSYSWVGPNFFTSFIQNPTITGVTVANSGSYSVTGSHNGCPARMDSIRILVNSFFPPAPIVSGNSPLCANRTLELFAQSGMSSDSIVTYAWTGPAGFTSSIQNPFIDTASTIHAGVYTVRDTFNACPSAMTTYTVVINADTPATITITPHPGDTLCYGDSIRFTTYLTNGGFDPAFQWMVNNSPILGGTFATYTSDSLLVGDSVYCILASSIQCPDKIHDTSNKLRIDILDNTPITAITVSPADSLHFGDSVTFSAVAVVPFGIITGLQWYLNGTAVPGATSTTFKLLDITHGQSVYFIAYTNAPCASPGVSSTLNLYMYTGIDNVNGVSGISIFPNPNSGIFQLKGYLNGGAGGAVQIEALNTIGQIIYNETVVTQNNELNTQVGFVQLPPGIYFLRLTYEGICTMTKFTVEK